MQLTFLKGYPDRVGKRSIFVGSGKGPKSSVSGNTPTDTLTGLPYQFYIDAIFEGSISVSGTYFASAQPNGPGPRATWNLRYFTTATGAEVSNATDLSAETFVISGVGGFS